jgi:hypothetical protein
MKNPILRTFLLVRHLQLLEQAVVLYSLNRDILGLISLIGLNQSNQKFSVWVGVVQVELPFLFIKDSYIE